MTRSTITLAFALALLGCEEQRSDVQNAVEAAKGMAELAASLKKAGEQAELAGKEAEKQAAADLAAGKDPAQVADQTELAKGLAGLQALSAGGGPAVNWRKLAPFLPDALGDAKAAGDLKGKTEKAGPMETSKVSRDYKLGESRIDVSIADSSAMPLIRAPFAMAAMIAEDSSEGYKKGTKIAGNTAIIEWREKSKKSEATALVGERFVVNVQVHKAQKPEQAEELLARLDLAELAKLKAEEPAAEGSK